MPTWIYEIDTGQLQDEARAYIVEEEEAQPWRGCSCTSIANPSHTTSRNDHPKLVTALIVLLKGPT